MTARLVRVSAAIRTKSQSTDSSASCARKRSPVGPPARPEAITGRPSSPSARATLTPLPPAALLVSTARWRWPWRKFGTAMVRSIAALSVTVRITVSTPRARAVGAPAALSVGGGSCASPPPPAITRRRGRRAITKPKSSMAHAATAPMIKSHGPLVALSSGLAFSTPCDASSGTDATRRPSSSTRALPIRSPFAIGPSTSSGASTRTSSRWSSRAPTSTPRRASSGKGSSPYLTSGRATTSPRRNARRGA